MSTAILQLTEQGLYCPVGDFHIDPWGGVKRAIITHSHSDHLQPGSATYLVARDGQYLARTRLPAGVPLRTLPYGESVRINGVQVSLHPAGHILGSAQVRIEYRGEVWVVSGDYKTDPDATCTPFELVRCHTFITEATFGLPIYRWLPQAQVFAEINAWWRANQKAGKASLLFGYALGKAQRLLAGVDASIGPIFTHGAVEYVNAVYRAGAIALPPTQVAGSVMREDWSQALIVAPPSAQATPWLRRFGDIATAFVSGWMRIRGTRRRRSVDRGFALSDHADWSALMQVIQATGAQHVWVTHGYTAVVARWLQEQGLDAQPLATRFEGETAESSSEEEGEETA